MNKTKSFFISVLLSGTVFLLSIAIVVAIYKWLWNHVYSFLTPVINFLDKVLYAPDFVLNVLAIIIVIAIAFFSGLVLNSIAKTYLDSFIKKILGKIPFYGMIKDSLEQLFTPSGAKSFDRKCLAKVYSDNSYSLGYITDEVPEKDMLVVYVPTAPVVSSGMIFYINKKDVIEFNVENSVMFRSVLSCGIGSRHMLKDIELLQKGEES